MSTGKTIFSETISTGNVIAAVVGSHGAVVAAAATVQQWQPARCVSDEKMKKQHFKCCLQCSQQTIPEIQTSMVQFSSPHIVDALPC
jgi:hypothetical protein